MKNSVRILTLVLAALMMLAVFAGCSNKTDDQSETTPSVSADTTAPTEDTTDSNVDANGFLLDDLPDDLNFNGDVVNVLHWNSERSEFGVEQITGNNVEDAIYQRNLNIQERLGVELNFILEKGSVDYMDSFVKRVQNSYNAGEKAYDIIPTYGRTSSKLAVAGYLADFNDIEDNYINFDQPWWPDNLVDIVGIGDSVYFISGDASTNTLHFMYTIYYNKQLIEDYSLEDPAELVLDHKWTLEKLKSMTADSYQDLDNDGKASPGDFFGFCSIYYGCTAFYTGAGLKIFEGAGDDLLKISDDYWSEKAINLYDDLAKWLTTADCWIESTGGTAGSNSNYKPFVDGRALFAQNRVYLADNQHGSGLNSVLWKYGLVPNPLFDETQENYYTVIGNPFTLYGIANDCDSMSEMTAVIECWGSEAYRLTTPAIFETNMKYKYTDLDISAQMFDILRKTSTFDMGRIFDKVVDGIAETPFKTVCAGGSIASVLKGLKKSYEKSMTNKIIKPFQDLQSKN